MRVRVVNGTVRSARTGGAACATCVPVQTFRTEGSGNGIVPVTNRVGGENPALSDSGVYPRQRRLRITHWNRARAAVLRDGHTRADNFDHRQHRLRLQFRHHRQHSRCGELHGRPRSSYPCQGSLRQFIINANALGGEGALAQSGSGQIDGANRSCRQDSSPAFS